MEALFAQARTALLSEQDTREQVIRLCRDITALSKKIIFALHRNNLDQTETLLNDVGSKLKELVPKYNRTKYGGNVSGAFEEMSEALTFEFYLQTGKLMTYEEFCQKIGAIGGEPVVAMIEFHYYFLGLFDLTGEIMRYCINSVAQAEMEKAVEGWKFLQQLYKQMSATVNIYPDLNFQNGVLRNYHHKGTNSTRKKMEVFAQLLHKVQGALCEQFVRGDEFKMEDEDEKPPVKRMKTEVV